MRPSEALALYREEVLAILAKYPVSNPRIFGSVARGEDVEGSDLDLLIEDTKMSTFDFASLELELEDLLRARVDVKSLGELSARAQSRALKDAIGV